MAAVEEDARANLKQVLLMIHMSITVSTIFLVNTMSNMPTADATDFARDAS